MREPKLFYLEAKVHRWTFDGAQAIATDVGHSIVYTQSLCPKAVVDRQKF
jgi:hypothetical protein